jgi:ubiquinone/menaquinone biosynthesis C-methylase UbiE
MAHSVCPWWLGYLLAIPLRRLWQNPVKIVGPFVREGMTVLEPGCGMGFFTLDLARMVGPTGRVVVVDVQQRMLAGLKRRAMRAGLAERIDARLVEDGRLGVDDLRGKVHFALAFAMVHEVPDRTRFLTDVYHALAPGARLLVAEPRGHVPDASFRAMLNAAEQIGYRAAAGPEVNSSHTALLVKG